MRLFGLLLFFVFSNNAHCQSGYFGSLNSFDIKLSAFPDFYNSYKLNDAGNEIKIRHKYGTLKYDFNFNRIVSKKVELSVGYMYARVHSNMRKNFLTINDTIYSGDEFEIIPKKFQPIDDVTLHLHTLHFNYRFYHSGSRAPIGKYIGFGFNVGMTKLSDQYEVYVGGRDVPHSKNIFWSKTDVLFLDTLIADEIKYRSFQLNACIGRNYALSKNILLHLGFTMPLYTIKVINGEWDFPIPIYGELTNFIGAYKYDQSASPNPNYYSVVLPSLKKYICPTFDIGLKIHF